MMVEEYSKQMPPRLTPYRVLDLERKNFRIPQNGFANIVSINLVTFAFKNVNTGNNQRLEHD